MPSALWPGMGQKTSYRPFMRVTLSFVLCPGLMLAEVALRRPGPRDLEGGVVWPLFSATKV